MFYHSDQHSAMSNSCPRGSKEAEELYQLGRQYRRGHGVPRNREKAEKLFEEALAMGNAKAALQIGQMYMWDYSTTYTNEKKREKYMIALYEYAAELGCPEAYLFLSECYEKGWGVHSNIQESLKFLLKSAQMGSPKGLEFYGKYLIQQGYKDQGKQLLENSMALGNGDAALVLVDIYEEQEDPKKIIQILRDGVKMGSKACLMTLRLIYFAGMFCQVVDEEYSLCFRRIHDQIDDFYPPKKILDFDKLCPPREILPFK